MKYAFDPAKDAINQAKHGVTLALAEILFAGPHVATTDDRFDYGEVRQIALGQIGGRVFVCVYVDRQAERRIISLRKANRREVTRYVQTHR
ncbi:BrnT family toxin [Rhodopila sp.]|uniref:BrnT family toxin n=1 Tax=Rhodopila sp. TaxID=2480087 RepID=UPI003D0B95C2